MESFKSGEPDVAQISIDNLVFHTLDRLEEQRLHFGTPLVASMVLCRALMAAMRYEISVVDGTPMDDEEFNAMYEETREDLNEYLGICGDEEEEEEEEDFVFPEHIAI